MIIYEYNKTGVMFCHCSPVPYDKRSEFKYGILFLVAFLYFYILGGIMIFDGIVILDLIVAP